MAWAAGRGGECRPPEADDRPMTYDRHAMLLLLWQANVRGYGVKWTDWLASARD